MKRAIVSVTNNLISDKRVNKTAQTLKELGFDVTLVGRVIKDTIFLKDSILNGINIKRFRLIFNKGPLFYSEYNIRLFFYLLLHSTDLLIANDLDTLPANYLAQNIKLKVKSVRLKIGNRKPKTGHLQPNEPGLIYDSHEYFTGVPELQNRKIVKYIWKFIEKKCFPGLTDIITVNDSIAELYKDEYHKEITVIRNITPDVRDTIFLKDNIPNQKKTREYLNLPVDKKIIILQGAGINIDRGAEEAIDAMQYVNNAILLIIGKGDVFPILKEMVNELYLQEKVKIINTLPFEELFQYTSNADLGLTLDKDTNINYKFSLPNKFFDYIHAGVPILASPLIEIKNIIDKYDIGETIDNHNPKHIAAKINSMLNNESRNLEWKKNLKIAAQELCWENEKQKLIKVLKQYA